MKTFSKALFSIFIMLLSAQAYASESPWVTSGDIQAKLIIDDRIPADQETLSGVIQIRHGAGWHSYWRSPGESGLAPRFDWSASKNIEETNIRFPIPNRYDEMGLTTFGYDGDLMLPFTATKQDILKPYSLAVKLDTMICNDICIPVSLNLSLDPATALSENGEKSRSAALLDFANTKIPSLQNTNGLKIENAVLTKEALVINAYSKRGFTQADLFVEIEGYALPGKPEITVNPNDSDTAMFRVAMPEDVQSDMVGTGGTPYQGKKIILTLNNGRESIERSDLF